MLGADLPEYDEHHQAKHGILGYYADAWLPKLGRTYSQVVIIDAFASAGRYRDGRRGSPLILLEAYLEHRDRDALRSPPHFIFVESQRDFAEHLQHEVNSIPDLHGATVDVIHGTYEEQLPRIIEYVSFAYRGVVPSFAFVDPRGYEDTPFDLLRTYRQRLGEKAEAMVYVPIRFMARFAKTPGTEAAMDRAFGSREAWQAALDDPSKEVGALLAEAYADVMGSAFERVSRFVVDPVRHNEYYLFFGTGRHLDGLREMKRAYWKIDPEGGTGYQQDARAAIGQGQIFQTSGTSLPPEERLDTLLQARFGGRELTIEEAEEFALTETRFRDQPHVRQALRALQETGSLTVIESTRKSTQHFPAGTRMRMAEGSDRQ